MRSLEVTGVPAPVPTSVPVHRIRYADDLKPDEDSIHLPLVQCRECHATGWGCVKHAGEQRVGQDLRAFYNRFFLRDVDVNYLFPLGPDEPPPQNVSGRELNICGRCGCLASHDAEACTGCGQDHLTRVFRPDSVVSKGAGKHTRPQLSRNCPHCGAREALIIVGARASSLLSTALAQLFASRHNDDRKAIAFSDNVQDAAHRGSFFAARTWRNGLRAAIAQVIEKNDGIALADLPERMLAWWGRTDVNPTAFDEERFISEFIAPDRLWFRDFEALRDNGAVPAGSRLLSWIQRRMRWDTLAELTFGAAVGRTLERTRVASVGVDREALERACEIALRRIREDFGELREIDEPCVRSLVLGVLRRMRERGAVESPMFAGYLRSGGNPYAIRDVALQDFGPRSSLPVFPAPAGDKHGVEALTGTRRSWYQLWVEEGAHARERPCGNAQRGRRPARRDERVGRRGADHRAAGPAYESVGAGPHPALRHLANRRHGMRAIVAEARCPGPRGRDVAGCPLPRSGGSGLLCQAGTRASDLGRRPLPAGGHPPHRIRRSHRAGVPAGARSSPGAVRGTGRQALGAEPALRHADP